MKKKLLNLGKLALLLFAFTMIFNACTKEYYDEYYVDEQTQIYQKFFNDIQPAQWTWVEANKRYELQFSLNDLGEIPYDYGAVTVNLFSRDKNNKEIQTPLPYINTRKDNFGNIFTETLSYELSLEQRYICFFLKSSDLEFDIQGLDPIYDIKLSIFYKAR